MNYEFLAEARDELWEAALNYESKEQGLGARFRAEVSHVIKRILADPYLWRERAGGYRRVNCPVFPYYVAYFIRKETILIAAVAHGHRRPGYWKERTKGA
jgi:plasmid stabilization system protein ParE